jgi:hypothetical protein
MCSDTGAFSTFSMRHIVRWQYSATWDKLMPTLYVKESPPLNITLFKGSQQVSIAIHYQAIACQRYAKIND